MRSSLFLLVLLLCSLRSKEDVSELYRTELNQIQNLNEDFRVLMQQLKTQADTSAFSFFHIGDSHVQIGSFTDGVMDELENTGIQTFQGWTTPDNFNTGHIGRDFSWKIIGKNTLTSVNGIQDKTNIGITGRTFLLLEKKSVLKLYKEGQKRISVVQVLSENNPGLEIKHKRHPQYNKNELNGSFLWTIGEYGNKKKRFTLHLYNNTDKAIPIYGIRVNENRLGVNYSCLGVSGATFLDWNEAALLEKQIFWLRPNLLLVTLGTNDAYRMGANEKIFKEKMLSLIDKIKTASPQTQILLMTAPETIYQNQSAMHLDFVNQTIREVATEQQIPLWDWYTISGGKNSFEIWNKYGMFDPDQLHLSTKGYRFLGKILVEALLKAGEN